MTYATRHPLKRSGSVYLAVLGSALIASVLALSALALQRVQNRQLSLNSDVRQAHLNAEAAVELGLLAIAVDDDWRNTYSDTNAPWFTRSTGVGNGSLLVTDPIDGDLTDDADEPFLLHGIGTSGSAEQRVERYVAPRSQPADVLPAAANAGGSLSGQSATVDWNSVVAAYQAVGTEINIGSLPTSTPNLGLNVGVESGTTYWDDSPGIIPSAAISQTSTYKRSGSYSLKVDRSGSGSVYYSGAAQSVDHLVEAGDFFYVEVWVYHRYAIPVSFVLTLYTKGSLNSDAMNSTGSAVLVPPFTWTKITGSLVTPVWSGNLEYAFVKIGGINGQLGNTTDFWVDDLVIREATTGTTYFIYHRLLAPGVNPFGAANAQGIYWINCGGNKVVIERSRILGTLMLINPGAGSEISNGPVLLAPATPGYPSLVVNGDFSIRATNRALNEAENSESTSESGTNFNPSGVPFDFNNPLCNSTDSSPNDVYPSEIQGLVAVSGNLTWANQPRVRGQVVGGGTITSTPSLEHRRDAVYSPPPGFVGPDFYERRPSSDRKAVLP